jgi:hypothetical protein
MGSIAKIFSGPPKPKPPPPPPKITDTVVQDPLAEERKRRRLGLPDTVLSARFGDTPLADKGSLLR